MKRIILVSLLLISCAALTLNQTPHHCINPRQCTTEERNAALYGYADAIRGAYSVLYYYTPYNKEQCLQLLAVAVTLQSWDFTAEEIAIAINYLNEITIPKEKPTNYGGPNESL